MKYWFKYTEKYQIPKPISWEGWVVSGIYLILVLVVTTVAVHFLEQEGGLLYYILTLAVGILILSITYSYIRDKKIDPSTKKQEKKPPKIKGKRKRKY